MTINVNLTFVSGVIHATVCAQSGAVAVTLPIAKVSSYFLASAFFPSLPAARARTHRRLRRISAPPAFCIQMRDWRRQVDSKDYVVGGGGEDAETIAAYFDLHGLSSSTGLIAGPVNHVRTFQTDRQFFYVFRAFSFPFCSSRAG